MAIASLLYVGFLVLQAYNPGLFKNIKLGFKNAPAPAPALAPIVKMDAPEPEKIVTPAGPNPPNAKAAKAPTVSPDAAPVDPYESANMETPVRDTLTHPEHSFGPGVEPTGIGREGSGISSTVVSAPLASFSPEYAQNGGSFMGSVFANDLQPGDDYATA